VLCRQSEYSLLIYYLLAEVQPGKKVCVGVENGIVATAAVYASLSANCVTHHNTNQYSVISISLKKLLDPFSDRDLLQCKVSINYVPQFMGYI